MSKYKAMMAGIAVLAVPAICTAAVVSLTGADASGTTSFDTAGLWDNAAAPSAGNDYVVDGATTRLRTPAVTAYTGTFGGDSLTLSNNGTATSLYGLSFKGGGVNNITINNLIIQNGGQINHINGTADVFNLYGNINMAGDGVIRAKQGAINIYSAISGSGQLTVPGSDTSACKLWIYSSANTYTGNIINNGRLGLVDDANLNFVIGAAGINNSVSSPGGQAHVTFDGDFVFDLSGASTTLGDSWAVITTTPASTYYGATFTVAGFADQGGGIWTGTANGAEYEFDTAAGTLSVIPEPATMGLVGIFGAGVLFVRRRFMI